MNSLDNILKYRGSVKALHYENGIRLLTGTLHEVNHPDTYQPQFVKNLFIFEFKGAAFDMGFLLDENFELHGVYQCNMRVNFIKAYHNLFENDTLSEFSKDEIMEYVGKICRREAVKLNI